MAQGLNKVFLMGNLGQEPELRYTKSGESILRLRLATNEVYINKNNEKTEKTEWHTIIMWGKRGEALNNILQKGKQIFVEGRLQTRQWEDNQGNKKNATEIVASNIILLGGKGTPASDAIAPSSNSEEKDLIPEEYNETDDDLPF